MLPAGDRLSAPRTMPGQGSDAPGRRRHGQDQYDAIVVGARCAGSPTAMLLARKGYKVLVVDRATFPSDTLSTHIVHPPGVAALQRWGLLDRLVATGCPPIDTYAFDFGPFTLAGAPGTDDRAGRVLPSPYGARQAARRRGVGGGRRGPRGVHGRGDRRRGRARRRHPRPRQGRGDRSPSAPTWSSAPTDGTRFVAKAVQPEQYNEKPPLLCGYYTYWSGLPMDGRFEVYIRPDRGFAAAPTHDDLTLVDRRLAVRRVRGEQARHRGQLPQGVRSRTGVRRADPRRQARSALRGHGGAELLPPALRSGLGPRRRRRVQQGLHHRAGDPRRVPRRRALCDRAGRVVLRSAFLRRRDGRVPVHPRRARAADVRVHVPAGDARAAAARDAAAARARCTATRRRWTGSHA